MRVIGAGGDASTDAVVDVPPMIRACVSRIDAQGLDLIDGGEHLFDFRPAGNTQQALRSGDYAGHGCQGFMWIAGAQNIDARDERAIVAARPADECEDAAGAEPQRAAAVIENLFLRRMAEADPALDLAFDVQKFDTGERGHDARPPLLKACSSASQKHSCVRKNPKESKLVKLRGAQTSAIARHSRDFGPR